MLNHFGFLTRRIPLVWLKPLWSDVRCFLNFRDTLEAKISFLMREDRRKDFENMAVRTLFHEIVDSKLSPQDLRLQRVVDEAMLMIGAGIESSKQALTVACYYVLAVDPEIEARLRAESWRRRFRTQSRCLIFGSWRGWNIWWQLRTRVSIEFLLLPRSNLV